MFIRRPAGHLRSAVGRSSRSSGGGAARRGQRCGAGPLETRLVEKRFSLMMDTGGQESGPAGGKTGA